MPWRNEIGSYLIITVVSVLIWLWAAGETREQKAVISKAIFNVPDDGAWIIVPDNHPFNMVIEGSRQSIQNVEILARNGFRIDIAPNVGTQSIDIVEALNNLPIFKRTGALLISIDSPNARPMVDRLVQMTPIIVPNLPGVQTVESQATIEPSTVTLTLPSRLQARYTDIRVQAFVEQEQSATLPEGVLQQLDVNLRLLPEALAANPHVHLVPAKARMSFTIRSQTRELKLDSDVIVQLATPPDDQDDFIVEFDTNSLRDVMVIADADLIRQIESGAATVIAFVHLSSSEKERIARGEGTATKEVSFFHAVVEDQWFDISVRVAGSDQMPDILLRVTQKQPTPSE